MRIIVIGGSIGGLAAALALSREGAEVVVLERRTTLEDEGTGLAVRPEAIEALRSLGVTLAGAPIGGWRYASIAENRVSACLEWKAPLMAYTYAAVRSALLAGAADVRIRTGACVAVIDSGPEKARVRVDDERLEADLVVAADGVDSLARRTLFPGLRAEPMGIVMWRGFAREDEARKVFGAEVLERFFDVNTQIFASCAKGWWLGHLVPERIRGTGRRFGWICYLRAEEAAIDGLCVDAEGLYKHWGTAPGQTSAAARDSLRAMLETSFPPPLVALSDIGKVSVHRVGKLVVPAMALGRVCLVGDAAHVVPPFTTAGSTLAIADGVSLARVVAAGVVTDASLAAWSSERVAAVQAIHAQADAIVRATIDQPPDLASASSDEMMAWARGFLPPIAAHTLRVVDHPLWSIANGIRPGQLIAATK